MLLQKIRDIFKIPLLQDHPRYVPRKSLQIIRYTFNGYIIIKPRIQHTATYNVICGNIRQNEILAAGNRPVLKSNLSK